MREGERERERDINGSEIERKCNQDRERKGVSGMPPEDKFSAEETTRWLEPRASADNSLISLINAAREP